MCESFSGFLFHPSPALCSLYCISVMGASFLGGFGVLGCQVLPAIGAVSILELAANSGSSRVSRAPNFNIARQLFTNGKNEIFCNKLPW